MTEVFSSRLQHRAADSGASPLITYYDESRGERIELSAISFANWVDKTAGLLTDEVLVEPGDRVRLKLATAHPLHWVTLVWVAASWRARCTVTLDHQDAAVTVVGPDDPVAADDGETIACSLHPFGLGFGTPLPAGVIDYGVEVKGFPDSFGGPFAAPDDLAWLDDERRLDHAAVVAGWGHDERRLVVVPSDESEWSMIDTALVRPVLGGGSSVIVIGASPDRRAAIAAAERADHV